MEDDAGVVETHSPDPFPLLLTGRQINAFATTYLV